MLFRFVKFFRRNQKTKIKDHFLEELNNPEDSKAVVWKGEKLEFDSPNNAYYFEVIFRKNCALGYYFRREELADGDLKHMIDMYKIECNPTLKPIRHETYVYRGIGLKPKEHTRFHFSLGLTKDNFAEDEV